MNSFLKKTLIFTLVMVAVLAAGWFGRKAYKKTAEHRLVADAGQYLEKRDFRNAGLCLQRALQINPLSLPASQLTGDMLEAVGAPAALSWRIRSAQLDPKDVQLRFAWAETALKVGDLHSADAALAGLDKESKATAVFNKLAGALAWAAGSRAEAEKYYLVAAKLEPTNPAVRINLATIHLASTNKDVANGGGRRWNKWP